MSGGLALIKIGIIQSDYADVLDLSRGRDALYKQKGAKEALEWLKWLLTRGREEL